MTKHSIAQRRGGVHFPEFTGERVYMRRFDYGLPRDLSRWQSTVDAMMDGIKTDQPLYLMIDQSLVKAGQPQRRPGIHIDGYWVESLNMHGHRGQISAHGAEPRHGGEPAPRDDRHRGAPKHMGQCGAWPVDATYEEKEGLLLASDIIGCQAYLGEFDDAPGEGGDCTHIDVSGMEPLLMLPFMTYAGNVTMLHESLPVFEDSRRTLVRINVPGWSPLQ